MSSGEEWANDDRGGCPIAVGAGVASMLLVAFAVYVIVSDLVIG